MNTTHTERDARQYVTDAIEASGIAHTEEYDLDAILAAMYDMVGSWDFSQIEADPFWQIVADNEA